MIIKRDCENGIEGEAIFSGLERLQTLIEKSLARTAGPLFPARFRRQRRGGMDEKLSVRRLIRDGVDHDLGGISRSA